MSKSKRIISIIIVIAAVWVFLFSRDILRCINYKKPVFVFPYVTSDGGGAGTYIGLGYSFKIKGSLMPEDNVLRVKSCKCYLFGKLLFQYR